MSLDANTWGHLFGSQEPNKNAPQPVIGVRVFRVDEEEPCLRALTAGYRWAPGLNYATCHRRQPKHRAGARNCGCGFYACTDLGDFARVLGLGAGYDVMGAVRGTGRTTIHERGAYFAESDHLDFRTFGSEVPAIEVESAQLGQAA